jgi:hypothetical protein
LPSPQTDPSKRRDPGHLGFFALYLVLAIALTYPLAFRLGSVVPNDLGDPLLNTWILWWNATHVPFTTSWWNAPNFVPAENAMAFSEHLAGLSPLSSPIYWLSGNALLSYNVVFLLSFPLSAFGSYLLCLHLTGRRDAAFIGGLAFGFAPYRVAQFPHLQVLATFWMPVALLGLHRFVRGDGVRWLIVFAAAWLMQALCNGYYLAFLSVLVAVWIVWFVPWRDWRTLAAIGAAWAVAIGALLPLLVHYRRVHDAYGFRRRLDEIAGYSADVMSVLDAASQLAVWGFLQTLRRAEGELFPGMTVVVVTVTGLIVASRSRRTEPRRWRTWLRLGLLAGLVGFGAAVVVAATSPGEVALGPLQISVNNPSKPVILALACLAGLLLLTRGFVDAVRRRSVLAFYVAATVLMWAFCLGPSPTLFNVRLLDTGPYGLLLFLPGFDALRVPARFTMLMVLCLSTAAALAYARIAAALAARKQALAAAVVAAGILADGWVRHMPLASPPAPWPRGTTRSAGAVLSLPLGDPGDDLIAMYRGISHGKPLANGYSGNFPAWYAALQLGLSSHDPAMLDELAALGVIEVVLDTTLDPDGAWDRYLRTQAMRLDNPGTGQFAVYRLRSSDRPSAKAPPAAGPDLAIHGIDVSVNPGLAPAMIDGNLQTRWESGPQTGKEEVIVDLGSARTVAAIVLSLGPYNADFPRLLLVEVSPDGQTWTEAWKGSGVSLTFTSAMRDPTTLPLTIGLEPRPARFVRLRQLGIDTTFFWSIAELAVR